MMITPSNLPNHELIGLRVRVEQSTNPSLVGIEGRIVDETQRTLVVDTVHGRRVRVPKDVCTFLFELSSRVRVSGGLLMGRPEDRISKRNRR
ncbi:MAG: ribonuclease P protein component 1 [Methermicoccaceae archaeon]